MACTMVEADCSLINGFCFLHGNTGGLGLKLRVASYWFTLYGVFTFFSFFLFFFFCLVIWFSAEFQVKLPHFVFLIP